MDGNRFDELTRSLATGRSRRSVLRGLVGGGAALAAMRAGSSLAAPPASKVTICHWNGSSYNQISVSQNAVPAHTAHQGGLDIISPDFTSSVATCGNCNTSCYAVDECTAAACINGVCNTTPSCTAVDSCTAACDEDGACIGVSACQPSDTCSTASCDGGVCTSTSSCGDGQVCGDDGCEAISPCQVLGGDEPTCWWMEIYSGNSCWVPSPNEANTQAECQALDSCSPGGGGYSGGGCYKWADSSDTQIAPPW